MRSLLFVPGDSERKLEKGFSSGADVVIVDLEDSVAPAEQAAARDNRGGFHRRPPSRQRGRDLCPRQRSFDRADRRRPRRGGAGAAGRHHAAQVQCRRRRPPALGHAARPRGRQRAAGRATRIIAIITETAAGVLSAGQLRDPAPAPCRPDLGRGGSFGRRSARAPHATRTAATPTCSGWRGR